MSITSTEFTWALVNIAADLMTSGFLWLLLLGSLGGFLAGLLGVGGGVLFIPVITAYLQQYNISSAEMVKFTLANSIARRITRAFITGRPSSEIATAPACFIEPIAASSSPGSG